MEIKTTSSQQTIDIVKSQLVGKLPQTFSGKGKEIALSFLTFC